MKTATHVFAITLAAVVAFTMTPAGQALIHQYPFLSGIAGVLVTLKAVYHDPKAA